MRRGSGRKMRGERQRRHGRKKRRETHGRLGSGRKRRRRRGRQRRLRSSLAAGWCTAARRTRGRAKAEQLPHRPRPCSFQCLRPCPCPCRCSFQCLRPCPCSCQCLRPCLRRFLRRLQRSSWSQSPSRNPSPSPNRSQRRQPCLCPPVVACLSAPVCGTRSWRGRGTDGSATGFRSASRSCRPHSPARQSRSSVTRSRPPPLRPRSQRLPRTRP